MHVKPSLPSEARRETYFKFARHFLQFPEQRRRDVFHVTGLDVDETTALPDVPVVFPLARHHPNQLDLFQLLRK